MAIQVQETPPNEYCWVPFCVRCGRPVTRASGGWCSICPPRRQSISPSAVRACGQCGTVRGDTHLYAPVQTTWDTEEVRVVRAQGLARCKSCSLWMFYLWERMDDPHISYLTLAGYVVGPGTETFCTPLTVRVRDSLQAGA